VGFAGISTRFTAIAWYAGADHIFPGVLASPVARDDVVYGELSSLFSAVLAGILVAFKNLNTEGTGKVSLAEWINPTPFSSISALSC